MYRATDNLRCYICQAALPLMLCDPTAPAEPPPGHKSHLNHLEVRPEHWRRLTTLKGFYEDKLEVIIGAWVDSKIPEKSLGIHDEDMETGERISVPCAPLFNIPDQLLRRPANLIRLAAWLDNLPFQTVQRILHLVFPQTHGWGFVQNDSSDRDKRIFEYFMWTNTAVEIDDAKRYGDRSVLIAYQPPWVLSRQDMKEFASSKAMPPFRAEGHFYPTPLQSNERLWAKIWDTCVEKDTRWFVVTTYQQWVFGVFTKGWTTAYVTSPYECDEYGPTILEFLTYWVACAMQLPGSSRAPQVPEPLSALIPPSIHRANEANCSTPEPSESNWDGKSVAAGSSAGASMTLSPVISEVGLSDVGFLPTPLEQQGVPLYRVEAWREFTDIESDIIIEPELPGSPMQVASGPPTPRAIPLELGEWVF
ncbi:hypothetical protein HGRIS_013087 [Hohenbuehelia grisea]|uniref:Uncharacterized protein n=1 Tax=Hohenbuehelia grisea TaxID=104357 RepID=A0ABR3IUD6_9AGAR